MKATRLELSAARITVRGSDESYVIGERVLAMEPHIVAGETLVYDHGWTKHPDRFSHWFLNLELFRRDLHLCEVLTRPAPSAVTLEGWMSSDTFEGGRAADYPWLYCVLAKATFEALDPWDLAIWREELSSRGKRELPGRTHEIGWIEEPFFLPGDVSIPWDVEPIKNWAFSKCESGPPEVSVGAAA